jgi:hypothetical protein
VARTELVEVVVKAFNARGDRLLQQFALVTVPEKDAKLLEVEAALGTVRQVPPGIIVVADTYRKPSSPHL